MAVTNFIILKHQKTVNINDNVIFTIHNNYYLLLLMITGRVAADERDCPGLQSYTNKHQTIPEPPGALMT